LSDISVSSTLQSSEFQLVPIAPVAAATAEPYDFEGLFVVLGELSAHVHRHAVESARELERRLVFVPNRICPKPVSSCTMNKMLGAPCLARSGRGQAFARASLTYASTSMGPCVDVFSINSDR
jgi:hypothetical protein